MLRWLTMSWYEFPDAGCNRFAVALAVLLVWLGGPSPAIWGRPQDATVRITSHGCSGVVIWTGPGRSYILTCAHGFQGRDRYKPIVIDAPAPRAGATRTGGIRVIRCGNPERDYDLCLIEMGYGPLSYTAPIAPAGHRPARTWSCGYDKMLSTLTVRVATIIGSERGRWHEVLTKEYPWHGRSGGPLIDPDAGYTLGTVIGYQTEPPYYGIYTSHAAVRQFCFAPVAPPRVTEHRSGLPAAPAGPAGRH